MEYISQLNAFFDLLPSNPLTPKAICLYSTLLHIDNKSFWKERFTVANSRLVILTGIDRRTLDRVRNELIQKNYIKYKKGSGNQAGDYEIIKLYAQNDTQNNLSVQNDTQIVTQNDTQMSYSLSTLIDKYKDDPIYFNLIKTARKKFNISRFHGQLEARSWASKQPGWENFTNEQQWMFQMLLMRSDIF